MTNLDELIKELDKNKKTVCDNFLKLANALIKDECITEEEIESLSEENMEDLFNLLGV